VCEMALRYVTILRGKRSDFDNNDLLFLSTLSLNDSFHSRYRSRLSPSKSRVRLFVPSTWSAFQRAVCERLCLCGLDEVNNICMQKKKKK